MEKTKVRQKEGRILLHMNPKERVRERETVTGTDQMQIHPGDTHISTNCTIKLFG